MQALLDEVSEPLTILVGSGVSLRGNIAPGVPEFIAAVLNELADRALHVDPSRDYATYRVGTLTKKLLSSEPPEAATNESGHWQTELRSIDPKSLIGKALQTKFEEVLRLCMDTGIKVTPMLKAAYRGQPGAYNANHSALAYLAGHCGITIITTNFDLGIENAGFKTSVVPENGSWPMRCKPQHPVLAKLHGCADKGEFVATSDEQPER